MLLIIWGDFHITLEQRTAKQIDELYSSATTMKYEPPSALTRRLTLGANPGVIARGELFALGVEVTGFVGPRDSPPAGEFAFVVHEITERRLLAHHVAHEELAFGESRTVPNGVHVAKTQGLSGTTW